MDNCMIWVPGQLNKLVRKNVPFEAEGMGYAPYNQVNRDAVAWLQENCGKWQARLKKNGLSGKMPEKDLPFKP